jgi:cytochrome c peroxidase
MRLYPSLLAAALGAGCAGDPGADASPEPLAPADLPWVAEAMPAAPYPADNPPSEAKRLLGRALFYDPVTSGDRATACVTCHSEIWGLGDQLPRSVGVEGRGAIGPGRVGPNMTRRNSPALWNAAHKERLFWDGRAATLEEQAIMPMQAADELARDPAELVAELRTLAAYEASFRAAFPDDEEPITLDNVARALATFVRAYQSDRAPYDQYLRGDLLALDEADRRGMQLFAELDCSGCHVPPRFESEQYADRAIAGSSELADEGRAEATGKAADRGLFRVPTLRNVRETGPFFHDGSVARLEDAVRHEVALQVAAGLRGPLDEAEHADLLGFIRRALVDTSREQHPPKSVPSGLPIPLDGDRLLRGGQE